MAEVQPRSRFLTYGAQMIPLGLDSSRVSRSFPLANHVRVNLARTLSHPRKEYPVT